MMYSVSVPVAVLLTLSIEADSEDLAQEAAKQEVRDNLENAVSNCEEIAGTPYDRIGGADGDNAIEEGELYLLNVEPAE